MSAPVPRSRMTPWFSGFAVFAVLAAAAVVVGVVVVRSSADDDPPQEIQEIVSDPGQWLGEHVTLSAQVAEVRKPFFWLPAEESDARLLVYPTPQGIDPTITRADALDLQGNVRRFDVAAFERDFPGSFDRFVDLQGQPVVVADRIDPSTPEDGEPGSIR